jgi:hypothetical protein
MGRLQGDYRVSIEVILDLVVTLGLGIGFAFLLWWANAPGREWVNLYTWMFVAAGVVLVLGPALIAVPGPYVGYILAGFVCVGAPVVVIYCTRRDYLSRLERERHAYEAAKNN